MAEAPVFDLAVPAPYDDLFVDGERALSVATPIDTAPGRTTFYLARWMNFLGGTYTMKFVCDDAAVWYVGRDEISVRTMVGGQIAQGVRTVQIYIPPGRQRLEIILRNISIDDSSCYVAFSFFQSGALIYASDGTDWQFDEEPIPDDLLTGETDQRRLLPVFTVMPNWKDDIVERITYNTDVLPSETDAEQRRALLVNPRRTFEAAFLRSDSRRARLDNFLVGVGENLILFPLWHEQYRLPTIANSGTNSLEFPSESLIKREFRVGDLCLIVDWRNPDDYEIVEIDDLDFDLDLLHFLDSTTKTWPIGALLIPLRVGRVLDSSSLTNHTDRVGTVQIRFSVVEFEEGVDPSWGHCVPLFRFEINWQDDLSSEASRTTYRIDNGVGLIDVCDPGQRSAVTMRQSVQLIGRERVRAMRAFIQMARGRAVRFYMPSQVLGIEAIDPVIDGLAFNAKPSGFTAYMLRPQSARLVVAFYFKDGRPPVYRTIVAVEEVNDDAPPYRAVAEMFTVDRLIPTINTTQLDKITFIVPSRFDQDGFEFRHRVADSAITTITLITRSTDLAGMPPLECVVTSRPYPIFSMDALSLEGAIESARYSPYTIEAIEISGGMLDEGELHAILRDTEMADEAIEISGDMLDEGELRAILRGTEMADEAIEVGGSIVDGSLRAILIEYTMLDEALEISGSIVEGSLI